MPGSLSFIEDDLPSAFQYRTFLSEVEVHALLDGIATLAFSDFEMRGVVARRRVALCARGCFRSDWSSP
jgi:hypothetical protein